MAAIMNAATRAKERRMVVIRMPGMPKRKKQTKNGEKNALDFF